jgi:hypothetical protein
VARVSSRCRRFMPVRVLIDVGCLRDGRGQPGTAGAACLVGEAPELGDGVVDQVCPGRFVGEVESVVRPLRAIAAGTV